jgi:peptidyl-prolyl cis-trans isomerase SurA
MRIARSLQSTLVILFVAVCSCAQAQASDEIAAIVNEKIITQSDLEKYLTPIYAQYQQMYKGEELREKLNDAREKGLQRLIEETLMQQEIDKIVAKANSDDSKMSSKEKEYWKKMADRITKIENTEIEEVMSEVRNRFSSQEEFEKALAAQNMTVAGLREKYKKQLMLKRLVDMQVTSRANISPQEVEEYYKTHKEELMLPDGVQLRHIFIGITQTRDARAAKLLADTIEEKLKKGESFVSLAKEYSDAPNAEDGGEMGVIYKGQFGNDFDKVIFALKEGDVSEAVGDKMGYHIFYLEKKVPSHLPTLEEVYSKIRGQLFQQKAGELYQKWIDELKKNSYVWVKEK